MIRAALIIVALVYTPAVAGQDVPLEVLYEQGMESINTGDWLGAIGTFESILEEDSTHTPSMFYLARAMTEAGQTGDAIETYRRLLMLDSTLFEAQMNLAILLSEQQDLEALDAFARAAELRPQDHTPLLYRAELLERMNQPEQAIAAYQDVLLVAPDAVDAHVRLGFLFLHSGQSEPAHASLLEASRLGTTEAAVFLALGDLEADQGRPALAEDHYRRAVELAGEDDAVRLRLAIVLMDQAKFAEAIPYLQQLPDARATLADAYFRNGDYQEAADLYAEFVQLEPENARHWIVLGRSYYELDRLPEAAEALERNVAIDPGSIAGWETLGAVYLKQEAWGQAAPSLERHLELRPDSAQSHFGLAVSLDHLEDFQGALMHYNRFIELDDGSNDARSFQVQRRAEALTERLNR
jgi:tetratricopeptide (TPR) repeat protein